MVILTAGTEPEEFERVCWKTQQDYAARIGAEWVKLELAVGREVQKRTFEYLATLSADTKCVILEWDIEVKGDAPNIFEEIDFSRFHLRRAPVMPGFFNLGVMVGQARHFAAMLPVLPNITRKMPTDWWEMRLNLALKRSGFEITPLPEQWNAIGHEGYFVHHLS
jgi:hypothetical protein